MACDIYCVADIVLFVIWLVSLPIYSVLIAALLKFRNSAFKSSFFKIFISLGIADVCSMVNIYMFVKSLYWRVYNGFFMSNPVLIATASLVWTWQSYFAQLNGVLLLTVNRFMAIVYPHKYEQIFTDQNTNRFIALQWVGSVIMVLPRTTLDCSYQYQADNKTLTFALGPGNAYYFQFATAYCFSLSLITLVLYTRMIAHVYGVTHQVAPLAAANQVSMPELRLAAVGLVVAVALFFFGLYCALMVVVEMNLAIPALQLLYFVVVDVFNQVNPYTIILLCTDVRTHLRMFLTGKTQVAAASATRKNTKSNRSTHHHRRNPKAAESKV